MPSYTGTLVDSPHRAEDTLRCSATIQGLSTDPITFPPEDIESVVPIAESTYTYVQQDELEVAYTGTKVDSFLDDYYYRVHISPALTAFGPIVSPTEETFMLWNAWFVTKSCSAVNESHPSEYSLDPVAGTFGLNALEMKTYTVSVDTEGSLEFEATITFTTGSETVIETITGTRVASFTFVPKFSMIENLEWLTDILKSIDGSEQRLALRKTPRQHYRFNCVIPNEQQQAALEAIMFAWTKRLWGIPVWGELVLHSAVINVNDTTISFDTQYADFRDSSYAIIWQDYDSYEVVKIATVDADKLNLEKPVLNEWTGSKFIMPFRIGYMNGNPTLSYDADEFGIFTCGFIIRYNELIEDFTPSGDGVYDGYPVLDATLEGSGLELSTNPDMKSIDFGMSDFSLVSDSDFNTYVQKHVFRYATKSDIWEFRGLLHYLYGRQGICWIITDKDDFEQTQTLGAAVTELIVTNVGWAQYMGLNTLRTHIAFIFPDGTKYYREITGITESGDEEIIGLSSALGVEVAVGDCNICMMDKCRLTDDKVEIEWQEPNTIISRINFTKVKA